MSQITVYLFESKGIQSYLTRTGKLKDMIVTSDRLVNLIDSNSDSFVVDILNKCRIKNNLSKMAEVSTLSNDNDINVELSLAENGIVFFRCKGGSFYCYSKSETIIVKFRSVWTLFFQQAFPGMTFTDVSETVEEANFVSELTKIFEKLGASFNRSTSLLPLSTVVCQSTSVSGLPAVKCNDRNSDIIDVRLNSAQENTQFKLYSKFLSEEIRKYDLKISDFFIKFNEYQNDENLNDIALIHLDGNAIGQTLQNLRKNMMDKPLNEYVKAMILFSEYLGTVTQTSVKMAMNKVIGDFKESNSNNSIFAFRPLVLGGDDVTLLIEPKYAMNFCIELCKQFKENSQKILKKLSKYVKMDYLTLSGGVLFNKLNHPYTNSTSIIESLADKAKKLTKSNWETSSTFAGPSAISFFRMSASTTENISAVIERSRKHIVHFKEKDYCFDTGSTTYYVNNPKYNNCCSRYNHSLDELIQFITKMPDESKSNIMGRLRRIVGEIAVSNLNEAEMIYQRLLEIDQNSKNYLKDFFNNESFFIENGLSLESEIDDILVLYHYLKEI